MQQAADLKALNAYSKPAPDGGLFCRCTAISLDGKGAMFIGPSGAGKSALALNLLALGADLVADDGCFLTAGNLLERPQAAPLLIEARGIGLLKCAALNAVPLNLIVDLAQVEAERLPEMRYANTPGGLVPLVFGKDHPFLAAALCQYLRHGRGE